jgi:hypothetical protein
MRFSAPRRRSNVMSFVVHRKTEPLALRLGACCEQGFGA